MNSSIQSADLRFFSVLAASGSLSAAGRDLGITTPAVSRRLAQMETRLGVDLVTRTTRRMSLTPDGELYLEHARRILGELEDMAQVLGRGKITPQGLLRVNASPGFGRINIAPVISRFVRKFPQIEVRLQLSVNPPLLTDDAFDVCVRFGTPPDTRIVARRIAANRRLLCASPAYLASHGNPKIPKDLMHHKCIGIRQGDEAYGIWRLTTGRGATRRTEAIRVRGDLASNDGAVAVMWALDGHGIVMRAEWDIAHHLRSGRLVQVLPNCETPDADIYAVYPHRHQLSTRVRAFVDFLTTSFQRNER